MLGGFKRAVTALACVSILMAGCGGGGGGAKSETNASSSSQPPAAPVPAQVPGSASLSWTAPTSNTDGSVLRNLAGFVVLYGTSPDTLNQTVEISNPSVDRYVVENLAAGTWYFAVQAVNSTGARSALSGTASKTVT